MERKKLILAGGLVVGSLLLVGQLRKLSTPQIVEVPAAPAVAVEEKAQDELVLFAIGNVARGERITEANMEFRAWPADKISPYFITEETRPQAIANLSGAIVRSDIFEGEPVNEAKLVRAGQAGLMAALLEPGMRAVTTRVAVDSAVGGFILPGDRVDIIQTVQLPRRRDDNNVGAAAVYSSTTIFQNVKVLAMNQVYASGPDSPASVQAPSYATFELSQDDAERLEEAGKMGALSLTLRGLARGGRAQSAATDSRPKGPSAPSTLVVYRNGRQTQAAVRSQ